MIGLDDDMAVFQQLYIACNPCMPSLDYVRLARMNGWTVRQFIENAKNECPADYVDWAQWCRTELDDLLTDEVKYAFSEIGSRSDPRWAAHADIYLADTAEEGNMLASRWNAEEFPNIARQLDEGIVERKRD
jgi:hypothetical protein